MGYAGYSDTGSTEQASSTPTTETVQNLGVSAEAARMTIIRGVISMTDDEVVSFAQRFFQSEEG